MPLETFRTGDPASEIASTPEAWLIYADALAQAAIALWGHIVESFRPRAQRGLPSVERHRDAVVRLEVISVYMMLAAFSLENLAKAQAIARKPDRVQPLGIERWPGGGHDLVALFELAAIELSAPELDLVRRLGTYGTWGGRYPVPMSFRESTARQHKRTDHQAFLDLAGRIREEMGSQ